MKKRGFGINKWNGAGGKVNSNETVEEAAKRETQEEIEVQIVKMKHMATLDFYTSHKPEWDQQVVVYLADEWKGEPQETEEMKPQWYKKDQLPFTNMWPDDPIWLPLVLNGKKVKAEFMFAEDGSIVDYKVNVV